MNLRTKFPGYRFGIEEGATRSDPAGLLLLCRSAEIYVHSQTHLGVATHGRGSVAKKLAALPCVRVTQDGSDGINAVFLPADFDAVAAIVKPRRRRKLSAEHRAKLIAAGKQFAVSGARMNAVNERGAA